MQAVKALERRFFQCRSCPRKLQIESVESKLKYDASQRISRVGPVYESVWPGERLYPDHPTRPSITSGLTRATLGGSARVRVCRCAFSSFSVSRHARRTGPKNPLLLGANLRQSQTCVHHDAGPGLCVSSHIRVERLPVMIDEHLPQPFP